MAHRRACCILLSSFFRCSFHFAYCSLVHSHFHFFLLAFYLVFVLFLYHFDLISPVCFISHSFLLCIVFVILQFKLMMRLFFLSCFRFRCCLHTRPSLQISILLICSPLVPLLVPVISVFCLFCFLFLFLCSFLFVFLLLIASISQQ